MLMGISGLCSAFDLSPLLSCMVFGASYINLTEDKKLFRQVDRFTPPVLSMFFIVSGMNLDLTALKTAGVIGIAYFPYPDPREIRRYVSGMCHNGHAGYP